MKPAEADCYRLIQMVALQQDPACIICGWPSEVGHHLFKRDRLATAFLPEAVRGLCNQCHRDAHNYPLLFSGTMIRMMGEDRYFELERLSWKVAKHFDFNAKRQVLKALLRRAA